eukprot:TRINITY_DN2885_c0_g2_i1.p2 TRINITY_DN2885_c0_g2~~TRINITY_DN2885_c0_g2_i1.p2  ORF type:complete len:245 (-),score=60.56 TRINITY_DN2885_c0_g2_i1:633-1367(-)
MSAATTVAVAPFVDARSIRVGNTFLPDWRDDMPRARCHSFSHRTLTHDRQFQPPQRSSVIERSQEEVETECSSVEIQRPRLLGRSRTGGASGVKKQNGMCSLPSGQLAGKRAQVNVQLQVSGKVAIEDLKAERCDFVDSEDLVCDKVQMDGDNSCRGRACRHKSRKASTCSFGTPSTTAPSSPVHSDVSSAEGDSSPATRQPVAPGQQRSSNKALKQEELLKQLMQTGVSAMARASAISKELKR